MRRCASTVSRRYRRNRFAWLFASLLLSVGAHPVLETLAFGVSPLQALLAVNLLVAIASLAPARGISALIGLTLAFAAIRSLQAVLGIPTLLPLSQVPWVAACLLAMILATRHALGPGVVDRERIFAALDVYLLAGLLFAVGYWVLDQTWPGSLGLTSGGRLDLPGAIYFSFVTMATVGYGDIIPISAAARGLAILESVGGQMYLVVLVARLVGLYSGRAEHSR